MKGLRFLILFQFLYFCSVAQVDLGTISSLLDQHPRKLEVYLQKKGFNRTNGWDSEKLVLTKNSMQDSARIIREFHINPSEEPLSLVYRTNQKDEFQVWKKEMQAMAVSFSERKEETLFFHPRYQAIFQLREEREDSTSYFILEAGKVALPKPKDLFYAEDLLAIDAHVYLENIFGAQNVKLDDFYFSESIKTKSSIIFPNTNRQAIFIWKDEVNRKDLAFIIFGEQSRTGASGLNQVGLSTWRSRQGISCGMNLKDVETVNNQPIKFYRWRSALAGTLAPENKGKLDFKKIELVFDCFNCNFLPASNEGDIIDSKTATEHSQRWYLSSFAVIK